MNRTNIFEERPLRRGSRLGVINQNNVLKGPSRVIRLCILGILLPTLLIALPLYMRYRVYRHQFYPLAISDMRIIDGKISTAWCQRQLLRANTTFNAFLLPETPKVSDKLEHFSMVRHLLLDDDMKEYWGFYLLKDSIVKVFTCVRWPGASLIVIRGHKHLHECAYIGDNSSEEVEEKVDGPANRPHQMRRQRPDVQIFQPVNYSNYNNSLIDDLPENLSDTEGDIKAILDNLQNKTKTAKRGNTKQKKHSTSTPDDIKKSHKSNMTSEELMEDILDRLKQHGANTIDVLDALKQKLNDISVKEQPPLNISKGISSKTKRELFKAVSETLDIVEPTREQDNVGKEEGYFNPDGIAEHRGTLVDETMNDLSNSEYWSSFSSSEEALLSCTGLILNLPLTPHHKCSANMSDDQFEETNLVNSVTYKVPMSGYYFFVFNSENEVRQNYLRVKFDLEKVMYDVSKPLAVCSNVSENCSLDLGFLSSQKVVLELPIQTGDRDWNKEFVAESECEPRSALYAVCVIAVPVAFMLFAFT